MNNPRMNECTKMYSIPYIHTVSAMLTLNLLLIIQLSYRNHLMLREGL
jgi:hypothetical protein